MHEVTLAQSVISTVENSLPKDFSKKIAYVHISIGVLSGIEKDALTFAFSIIKKDTILSNAEIVFETVNGLVICNECNFKFEMNEFGIPCPECGSYSLKILQGKEMKVTHISVDD